MELLVTCVGLFQDRSPHPIDKVSDGKPFPGRDFGKPALGDTDLDLEVRFKPGNDLVKARVAVV